MRSRDNRAYYNVSPQHGLNQSSKSGERSTKQMSNLDPTPIGGSGSFLPSIPDGYISAHVSKIAVYMQNNTVDQEHENTSYPILQRALIERMHVGGNQTPLQGQKDAQPVSSRLYRQRTFSTGNTGSDFYGWN